MVDVALSGARLLFAFFLVALNGFFVAAEFAFVRIRSTSVDRLVAEGRTGAATLQEAMANLDDYLAVTQLGITIASLGLGWIGEPAVAAILEPLLASVLPAGTIHLLAIVIGFAFVTFLHVVFGELAPKTIAIARAERIALLVAPPMKAFYYLFVPGIVVFNGTANAFTTMIGIPPASEAEETFTEEEILAVLSRAGTEGDVDKEEVEMIERIFALDDTTVREVMIPRPDVVAVPATLPLSDLRGLILEAGHTRYPVLDGGEDVVGFVDVKDVLRADETDADPEAVTAGDLAREVPIVPETARVNDVLAEFQERESQMAAIVDEWGVFEGIVTVEDVVEVIVGDIRDAFDRGTPEPSIDRLEEGVFLADGGVAIALVNDRIGSKFEGEDVETIGGLVLEHLGRVPETGDSVALDGYRLTVEGVENTRISRVRVREEGAPTDDPEE